MKKKIFYVLLSITIGVFIGKYIYNSHNSSEKKVFNEKENIYMLQYGVYKNKSNMENSTKDIKNYFYFTDQDGYHVIIGITKKESLKEKIINSYKITDNIYLKEMKISNSEFLLLLDQYDSLIENTNDNDTIFNAQKQILSKYEELILQNG